MGFLARMSTTAAPARVRANAGGDPFAKMYSGFFPPEWGMALSAAGVPVTPDLAMTLAAMYAGVTMIGMDLATLPAQMFKNRDDGGKDRVRGGSFILDGGIGQLAYKLRWAPNGWQTAAEFWLGMIASYLLREVAYAEIASGPSGFIDQLLPRHPSRVRQERLPSGRLRFRLTEADGKPRYLTQDEMFVVRGLSFDGGMTPASRVTYGAQAIGSAIATQTAVGKFFKSGMTAAKVATYEGEMSDEEEAQLHASISRFAAGVENSFGLALVPDKVTITNLGVEPDKAQMMVAQEWGVRQVALLLRLPPSKLGIQGAVSYNSQVQSALDYVISTLRPIAITFEQAIQRDLIVNKDNYLVEFLLQALMRGDFESQSKYMESFVRSRIMRPSECRVILNMNPDEELDRLSENDHRPGQSGSGQQSGGRGADARAWMWSREAFQAMRAIGDNAGRCVRRERLQVEKLAKKHANDVDGWKAGLRDFYAEHARFIAATMHVPMELAREYAAQHGSEFECRGVAIIDGDAGPEWERDEADELIALSLGWKEAA